MYYNDVDSGRIFCNKVANLYDLTEVERHAYSAMAATLHNLRSWSRLCYHMVHWCWATVVFEFGPLSNPILVVNPLGLRYKIVAWNIKGVTFYTIFFFNTPQILKKKFNIPKISIFLLPYPSFILKYTTVPHPSLLLPPHKQKMKEKKDPKTPTKQSNLVSTSKYFPFWFNFQLDLFSPNPPTSPNRRWILVTGDDRDVDGRTAPLLVTGLGSEPCVRLLAKAGANLDHQVASSSWLALYLVERRPCLRATNSAVAC